jgi:hypothetical protein
MPALTVVASAVQSITIGLVIAAVTMTAVVLGSHYQAWRRAPSGSGIIPLHVTVISTAHLIFMVLAAVAVVDRLGRPLNPFTVAFGAASVLTLAALYVVGAVQWRRIRASSTS